MNSWYYSQADQAVGPFQMEVLLKLARAGVIDDITPVRQADQTEWQPLATVVPKEAPTAPPPVQQEVRYYYLDAANQPVGPFDVATIQRLHTEKVIRADTLVSGIGEPKWIPATTLLGIGPSSLPTSTALQAESEPTQPVFREFKQFALVMGVSLTLYQFYLVPLQTRDIKAITNRPRLEFTALLILGIVTLGFALLVMLVLWAFDLERHGRTVRTIGRQESLGVIVLCLAAFGRVLPFMIDAAFPAFLLEISLIFGAIWMVQKEINLYAAAPEVVTGAA